MSFDYAKICTVVEDRRNMLLATVRGLLFVLSRPFRTFGVYLGILIVSGLLLVLYVGLAPGIGQSDYAAIAWAFLVSKLFLIARLFMRLWLLGGQTVLFQLPASGGEAKPEAAGAD